MNGKTAARQTLGVEEARYHPLRNHNVLLHVTPQLLDNRQRIVLTDRDRALLVEVYRHGFLTAEHVALVFFPPPSGTRMSHPSACFQRLRELWLWRYLDRVQRPVSPAIGGSRPLLHVLGPRGVGVVAASLGVSAGGAVTVWRRQLDRLNDSFVDHDLRATDLWANLAAHLRRTRIRRWHWTTERELRARSKRAGPRERAEDPKTHRPLAFLPDGLVALTYPDGRRQIFVVEIDNGSHDLDGFARKVRAFELYRAQGCFHQAWHADTFEVLVVTTSQRRLDHLWGTARTVVVRERWPDYSFSTFDVLRPDRFATHDWLTLTGERTWLLHRDAYAANDSASGKDAA